MAKVKSKKRYKGKPEKRKEETKVSKTDRFFTVKSLSYFILFAIFLLSFYIRGIIPIKNVFREGFVAFAADDSIEHMRLVENTINFFPHRIFYDPFTYYPFGAQLHWGPLFDQINAFFALIAGLIINGGMPTQSTINSVGAFYPAILGALVVFPVYFIGKELLNEKAGILGAFLIAILPGQWLSRSVLGFTDNHVAEVFWLTLMMMFFVIAIKKAENITFDHWLNKDWATLKTSLMYSIFAGVSFGAYLLTWTDGVFFAVVFAIFVIIQYVIDHFRGKSTEYLGIVGIIAYVVAMIMVIPYVELSNGFDSGHYSLLHLTVTGGMTLIFAFLSLVSREMNKRGYRGWYYLLFISGLILIGLIAIKMLIPGLYVNSIGQAEYIFKGNTGGGLTIAEASPINPEMIMGNFGYNFYLAYIAILALCYYIIRKSNAEYTLIVVWSVFTLAITLAQNRFAYYYAVNVAILIGFLGAKILDFSNWRSFNSDDIVECLKKIRIQHVLSLILVIAVTVFLPPDTSPYKTTTISAQWLGGGEPSGGGYNEWFETLNWMRYNTPDPGLDYYAIYERPNSTYPYPETAYGVMSWWDYGNTITYFAHRIPNADPFQAGIGGGSQHAPGASTFLVAQTEEGANEVLDKLGVNGKPGARYVMSNAYMAYAIMDVFVTWNDAFVGDIKLNGNGECNAYLFQPIQTSQGRICIPIPEYYNTMEAKLHIFDGNGLKRYRLVHESPINPYTQGGNEEQWNKNVYDVLYRGKIPVENSGLVKVFEYVKGAKIAGLAPPNSTVTLTNTIKTNIGRTIHYSQTTASSGTYEFTVPYSTLGPIPGETQFDTKPTGPYTVTFGNVSKQIDVNEKDVLEGNTVTLNLI